MCRACEELRPSESRLMLVLYVYTRINTVPSRGPGVAAALPCSLPGIFWYIGDQAAVISDLNIRLYEGTSFVNIRCRTFALFSGQVLYIWLVCLKLEHMFSFCFFVSFYQFSFFNTCLLFLSTQCIFLAHVWYIFWYTLAIFQVCDVYFF